MYSFFKYTIYSLIGISLVLFYLLFTPMGHTHIYSFVSQKLSQKIGLSIAVQSINIERYPHVDVTMYIEKKAKLTLHGLINDSFIDMDYALISECVATKLCQIKDDLDIHGHIKGPFTKLYIAGEGKGLDGYITYHAVKYTQSVQNLSLKMSDVNSTKLFNLLGQEALIRGKANVNVTFKYMDHNHKQGTLTYDVKDKNFKGIPLALHSVIHIEDIKHTFLINITSPYLKLDIYKGTYQQNKKLAHAFYSLNVLDLSKLEYLLGYKYLGALQCRGEIDYDKTLHVNGLSKSFGGMVEFLFTKNKLSINLKDVLFQDVMALFPYPPILKAHTTGKINYDFKREKLTLDTKLKNATFVQSKIVNIILKKSGANLLQELFTKNTLRLTYQKDILLADLKLSNAQSHIIIKNIKIHTKNNSLNAYFDFTMQKQAFSGKVYGSMDNPQINLDMQKLVRYQMDKQVDKMMGERNRKLMESMPMAPIAKDMATGMGASFMKVFF